MSQKLNVPIDGIEGGDERLKVVKEEDNRLQKLAEIAPPTWTQLSVVDDFFNPGKTGKGLEKMEAWKKAVLTMALSLALFISLKSLLIPISLPQIVSDFRAVGELSWVILAIILTYNAVLPIYGKFSNIYGRKHALMFAFVCYIMGSVGCGLAKFYNWETIIISRAVQGIGSGGIHVVSVSLMSEILKDKRYFYLIVILSCGFVAIFDSMIAGLVSYYGRWEISFFVNSSLASVACVLVAAILKPESKNGSKYEKLKQLDYTGALLHLWTTQALFLAIGWSSVDYAWGSTRMILALATAIFLFTMFVYVESLATIPIIPHGILNKTVIAAFLCNFFMGIGFFGAAYFTSIFLQIVKGWTGFHSGLALASLFIGAVLKAGSIAVTIQYVKSWRLHVALGTFTNLAGFCVLSTWDQDTTMFGFVGGLFMIGVAFGSVYSVTYRAIHSSSRKGERVSATILAHLMVVLGGALGVAFFSSIFSNSFQFHFGQNPYSYRLEYFNLLPSQNFTYPDSSVMINSLSVDDIRSAFEYSLHNVFLAGIPFAFLALASGIFIVGRERDNAIDEKYNRQRNRNTKLITINKDQIIFGGKPVMEEKGDPKVVKVVVTREFNKPESFLWIPVVPEDRGEI